MNVADKLNAKGATPETILQIMDATVFEASGDRSPEDMIADLRRVAGDTSVDAAMEALRAHPEQIERIALSWISDLSALDDRQALLDGAIEDADKYMPALEIGAVTLVTLYALYLMGANKLKRRRRSLKRRADNSYEVIEEEEFADFSEPVRGFIALFKHRGDKTTAD